MAQRYSGSHSRTVSLVRRGFTLEAGLLSGLTLTALGAIVDGAIAAQWISTAGGGMDSTVHLAFVATTALVLGLNLIFSSFLLNMILAEQPPRAPEAGS